MRSRVRKSATGSVIVICVFFLEAVSKALYKPLGPTSIGLFEREAERFKQRPTLVVVLGSGHHGDVHAADAINRVLIDLMEH